MSSEKPNKPFRIQFWSSTEYSGFLAGLIRELNAHSNIEAEQRFSISESSYRSAHSWIARKWLRVQQYIIYPIHLMLFLIFRKRADVAVVCTNTFFAPLLATYFHRRVIHLVYDVFPEALIHAGKMNGVGLAARMIHGITQKTFDRAEANVFLGERLRAHAAEAYALRDNCTVIAVGADDHLFQQDEPGPADTVTILYCGNLGHMHDIETLFGAWQTLAGEAGVEGEQAAIRFRFHSVGPRYNELLDTVELLKGSGLDIKVGPGLPQADWIRVMEASQVALVTMVPGSDAVVMPSKAYSAMAAGQALLAVAPETSDLVSMIEAHQCGWWVKPGNVDALVRLIQQIRGNPDAVWQRRINAQQAAREHYSQRALADKWLELIGGRG